MNVWINNCTSVQCAKCILVPFRIVFCVDYSEVCFVSTMNIQLIKVTNLKPWLFFRLNFTCFVIL